MEEIKNEDLKIKDIEDLGSSSVSSREDICYFSMTYDGYVNAGSFKECADISFDVFSKIEAGEVDDLTLSQLRTGLFFYFRGSRNNFSGKDITDHNLINALLGLIRERVVRGELS